jgi:hypothetical protein
MNKKRALLTLLRDFGFALWHMLNSMSVGVTQDLKPDSATYKLVEDTMSALPTFHLPGICTCPQLL